MPIDTALVSLREIRDELRKVDTIRKLTMEEFGNWMLYGEDPLDALIRISLAHKRAVANTPLNKTPKFPTPLVYDMNHERLRGGDTVILIWSSVTIRGVWHPKGTRDYCACVTSFEVLCGELRSKTTVFTYGECDKVILIKVKP